MNTNNVIHKLCLNVTEELAHDEARPISPIEQLDGGGISSFSQNRMGNLFRNDHHHPLSMGARYHGPVICQPPDTGQGRFDVQGASYAMFGKPFNQLSAEEFNRLYMSQGGEPI